MTSPPDGDVVVVGDLLVDIVVTIEDEIAFGSDTPARIDRHGGGSAANTAAWLGELGVPVRLVAAVGDDAAGREAVAELTAGGVSHVGPVVAGHPTGTCVVIVDHRRERTMFPDRGANTELDRFDPARLDARPIARLHVSGYALLDPASRSVTMASMEQARRAAATISVDAASAAPLRVLGPHRFLGWLTGVDELFANDDEVEALGGEDGILEHCRVLVRKHGSEGVTWTDGHARHHVDARRVDAVDSTGAGDAFAAGWIAASHRGATVPEALEAARDLAAQVVTTVGARPPQRPPI